MPYYINPPPQTPLNRILAGIIAVLALVGSFIIGTAALLVIAGLGLIAGLALWMRVAWIKHQLRKNGVDLNAGVDTQRQSGEVIDAEYTVVSVKDRQDDQ